MAKKANIQHIVDKNLQKGCEASCSIARAMWFRDGSRDVEWNNEINNASKQFTFLPSAGKRQSSLCTSHLLGQTWSAAHYYGTAKRKVLGVVWRLLCSPKSVFAPQKTTLWLHSVWQLHSTWPMLEVDPLICIPCGALEGRTNVSRQKEKDGKRHSLVLCLGIVSCKPCISSMSSITKLSLQCQLCRCHSMSWNTLKPSERFPAVAGHCTLDGSYEGAQLLNLSFGIQHLVLQFGHS